MIPHDATAVSQSPLSVLFLSSRKIAPRVLLLDLARVSSKLRNLRSLSLLRLLSLSLFPQSSLSSVFSHTSSRETASLATQAVSDL